MRRAGSNRRFIRGAINASSFGSGAGGAPAAFAPEDISSAYAWYRADTGVTTLGGPVSLWTDQVGAAPSGGDAAQGNGTRQPASDDSDAGFNNQASIAFDGTSDVLVCGTAIADWRFLHDGTGCTIYIVARSPAAHTDGTLFDTANVSGGNNGFTFYHQSSGTPIIRVTNSAGNVWTTGGALSTSTTYQFLITHSTGAGFVYRRNGAEIATGAYGAAANAGNPPAVPTIGGSSLIANFSNWTVAEVFLCNAVISAGDITSLETYGATRYAL